SPQDAVAAATVVGRHEYRTFGRRCVQHTVQFVTGDQRDVARYNDRRVITALFTPGRCHRDGCRLALVDLVLDEAETKLAGELLGPRVAGNQRHVDTADYSCGRRHDVTQHRLCQLRAFRLVQCGGQTLLGRRQAFHRDEK